MTLYDIDQAIMACFDPETGDLVQEDQFEQLKMERSRKIENVILWYKDLKAEAEAIGQEIISLKDRKESINSKAERLKAWFTAALAGEKFSTPRCDVRYRMSKSVEIFDPEKLQEFESYSGYEIMRYKDPEPNKTMIKDLIQQGVEVPGARIVENRGVVIK